MKETIIQAATLLFNTESFGATSLRAIAAHLQISDGHLRYYFKTKEELVLAIFNQMDAEIKALAAAGRSDALQEAFRVMYRYSFIFTEMLVIFRKLPRLRNAYWALYEERRQLFETFFEQLKREGVLAPEFGEMQQRVVFEQFFIISDNWIKYVELKDKERLDLEREIRHYSGLCLALLEPWLQDRNIGGRPMRF